jgi:hypothetical protein
VWTQIDIEEGCTTDHFITLTGLVTVKNMDTADADHRTIPTAALFTAQVAGRPSDMTRETVRHD